MYVRNNPLRWIDLSGLRVPDVDEDEDEDEDEEDQTIPEDIEPVEIEVDIYIVEDTFWYTKVGTDLLD